MLWIAAAALGVRSLQQPDRTSGPFVAPCYRVHGRLEYYNGGPSTRIWIVGTHRMLGVPSEDSHLPANVRPLLNDFGDVIYADFEVCPLTPDRPDHMRFVVVKSATHVVHRREEDRN